MPDRKRNVPRDEETTKGDHLEETERNGKERGGKGGEELKTGRFILSEDGY